MAIKLFLLPLAGWLWFTGRRRAAIGSVLVGAGAMLACWAAIGFRGLRDYPTVLSRATAMWQSDGPFIQGLMRQLGASRVEAVVVGLAVAVLLFGAAARQARVNELGSLALIISAAIFAAPVSWVMSIALLFPLMAVKAPRFSRPWLIVPLFWVHWWYSPIPYRSAWLSLVTMMLLALLVVVLQERVVREPQAQLVAARAG